MSARTGLTDVEVAVLTAVARHDDPIRTSVVLAELDADGVIGPRAGYPVMHDLQRPWRRHLPLLQGEGNWGSPGNDPPADAEYTEVTLTPVGRLAVAAEAGELGPLPLGLIDGSWYRGGPCPPFGPIELLDALHVGSVPLLPRSPGGGTIGGDLAGLAAGREVELELGSTLEVVGDRVVITALPYGGNPDDVAERLANRAVVESEHGPRRYADRELRRSRLTTIVDIDDLTSERTGLRLECRIAPGMDPAAALAWVASTWPITRTKRAKLPAPLPELITSWDAGDGSGLAALVALLGSSA